MATGSALFKLVKTLTRSEKKAFTQDNDLQKSDKIYTEILNTLNKVASFNKNKVRREIKTILNQKEKNYSELFNVLNKLKAYNQQKVLNLLGNNMTPKDLRALEVYLYKKIISSLKKFHAKKSIDIQINDLILEAKVLYDKGFYDLAINIFTKAENLALKYNKRSILLEIAPFKAESFFQVKKANTLDSIKDVYITAKEVILTLEEEFFYRHENVKLVATHRTSTLDPTNLDEIKKNYQEIKSRGFPATGSFYSQYYYHSILAISEHLQKNHTKAAEHQMQVLLIWKQSPDILKKNLPQYITQLANNINYLICAEKYSDALFLIDEMEKLPLSHSNEQGELYQNLYFYKQSIYLNQQDYTSSKKLIPFIKECLRKHKKKISTSRKLSLSYNIALTYWLLNEHKEALTQLEKLISEYNSNENRPEIIKAAHLLQLATFYLDEEFLKLEDKIFFIKKNFISKKQSNYDVATTFEEILVYYFRQLKKTKPYPKKDRQIIMKSFKEALEKLQLSCQKKLGHAEYLTWINNALNNKQ